MADVGRQSVPEGVIADASYALELAGTIARGAWDDWVPGSVPFVIVYPDQQWLFRSGGPLPGYDTQAFSSTLGTVYRAPSWTRYDGVRAAFAPPRFFAQADRFGEALTFTIAAPSLAPFPSSDWATVFAHEYFHTFQMTDARWAGDFSLIAPRYRQRLADLYQNDADVRASISRELEQYAARLHSGKATVCDDLNDVVGVRSERFALLNAIDRELPKAERALERFEGIARYVEEKAYDLVDVARVFRSREPGWQPTPAAESMKRRLSVTAGEYYYATGDSLARILDACNPSWKKSLVGKDLVELARSTAAK